MSDYFEDIKTLSKLAQPVTVTTDFLTLASLIAAVQCACRNPNFDGRTKEETIKLALVFQGIVSEQCPELTPYFEQGWLYTDP